MKTVAVIGAGTMGAGIAQASALAGYDVVLYDVTDALLATSLEGIRTSIEHGVARGKTESAVAEAAREAIQTTTSLETAARADLIIEAAPEKLPLKREIFATLDAAAPDHAIFGSNTSSLSVNALASAVNRADRFLGVHFFNPAHIMKLVELIRGDFTSEETLTAVQAYVARLGKTAVLCKDTPAFIVNRVARPFYGEAFRLLGEPPACACAWWPILPRSISSCDLLAFVWGHLNSLT